MRDSGDKRGRARRVVEDGKRRVAAQEELVERLRAGGDRASEAEEIILRSMDDMLRKMRRHLKDVCR